MKGETQIGSQLRALIHPTNPLALYLWGMGYTADKCKTTQFCKLCQAEERCRKRAADEIVVQFDGFDIVVASEFGDSPGKSTTMQATVKETLIMIQ